MKLANFLRERLWSIMDMLCSKTGNVLRGRIADYEIVMFWNWWSCLYGEVDVVLNMLCSLVKFVRRRRWNFNYFMLRNWLKLKGEDDDQQHIYRNELLSSILTTNEYTKQQIYIWSRCIQDKLLRYGFYEMNIIWDLLMFMKVR